MTSVPEADDPNRPLPPGAEPVPAEGRSAPEGAAPIEISIIIVVYRTPEMLRRCLDFLEAARIQHTWEAIVIDNAPDFGDGAAICAPHRRVRYVPNPRNVGFGRACNQGMRMAGGRHFLLLNPDMEVRPGAIEALYALVEREPDVGIVAPRLHYPDGRLQESCRTFYTVKIFLLRRTVLGRLFPNSRAIRHHLMLDWDHATTREVDWCIGACQLVRREAVEDVGYMDERFFMYFEDVDWCYRMHQRGWRVLYHPEARMVHHYQRASARAWPGRGLWVHLASTFRYYEKWSFVLYWLKLRSRLLRNVALFLGDLLMVTAAFIAAYALRSLARGVLTKPLFGFEYYLRFLGFTLVVAMASFSAFGLYRAHLRPSVTENLLPVARALAWTSVLMMASTFLFSVRIFSRFMVVLFFPLSVLAVTLARVLLMRAVWSVRRRDLNLRRLAVLGPPDAVEELLNRFREHGSYGMDPVPLPVTAAPRDDVRAWARRLRTERAQEVLLFEDWPGDVRGLLLELRESGLPVRLLPALRSVLPLRSQMGEFMGWPAVRMGGEVGAVGRSPARRIGDAAAAVALALLGLIPFLTVSAGRRLRGRPATEVVTIRGYAGRPQRIRRLRGARRGRGFARGVLDAFPALGSLLTGRLALVGLCPIEDHEWERMPPAYRDRPPEAPAGLFGPWTTLELSLPAIAVWNARYPEWWSEAEDFRIFWRALLGRRSPTGETM